MAQEAAEKTEQEAADEQERIQALEVANLQTDHPPTKLDNWTAHVISGIAPVTKYIFSRLFEINGDKYKTVRFYQGRNIFDPLYAKTIDAVVAALLIDKMNCYDSLTKGEGYHTLIQRLKDGFRTYK